MKRKQADGWCDSLHKGKERIFWYRSCEVDGCGGDLMSGEEASGVEQLHELR